MFVTTLNFSQVLERFYEENKYDFLLLFVSSFDGKDKEILEQIVDNAKRIDKITGERICFYYFIQDRFDSMNQKITRLVKNISDWQPLYGEGVSITMETSDDICAHFGLLRSYLPAFILVPIDRREEPQIISIKDYQDLESLLSPLNTLNSYLFDRDNIIYDYNHKKQNTITQETIEIRKKQRISWSGTIQYLERKKARAGTDCTRFDSEIRKLQIKLEDYPELHAKDVEGSVEYPVQRLLEIKDLAVNRLNMALNSHEGEWLVKQVENVSGYSNAVLKIWDLVRTRGVRISRVVEDIRRKIYEEGFDVFISCKSQDYAQAHGVYEYLKANGYKPFLADHTLKEIGVDQYTAVIGEVINVCQNMVVFATNVDYLDTPYVHAEWHAFVNDINTGHKPNARLINLLSPDIDIHALPGWLRDKQCFTTENYKEGLLDYFDNGKSKIIHELKDTIEETYYKVRNRIYLLEQEGNRHQIHDYLHKIEQVRDHMLRALKTYKFDSDSLGQFRKYVIFELIRWEDELLRLLSCEEEPEEYQLRRQMMIKEARWHQSANGSPVLKDDYRAEYYFVTALESEQDRESVESTSSVSYIPFCPSASNDSQGMTNLFRKLFARKTYNVYSSIFAPVEVKRNSHMLVQVYLHLDEECEKVIKLAKEVQKDAERRDYIPLHCKLRKGDKVDVHLNVYGESLLMADKKSMIWQGSFTKCSFDYRVPKDIDVDELSCKAILVVGGVPVGEMNFITEIVDGKPRPWDTEIKAHNYRKVFISYAHKDEQNVKFLAKGLEMMGVDHFFDRKYLKAGDIFPQVIEDYINTADLFVLCWSENAVHSEYVKKEYTQALGLAFPQVKPQENAKLSIYPMSIEPRAELPDDMKNDYHFGDV